MLDFSAKNSTFLFVLSGVGEETGDIWTKYFIGGRRQVAKAVLQVAPFDPKKLGGYLECSKS